MQYVQWWYPQTCTDIKVVDKILDIW
jgi:hypothetical protein